MNLFANKIGDGGAIALAESLKATLLISFRPVRAMCLCGQRERNLTRDVLPSAVTSVFRWYFVRPMRCDVCVCAVCSGVKCCVFVSCVRALAPVHAVETLQQFGKWRRRQCRTIPCVRDARDENVLDVTGWSAVGHGDTRNMRQ